MTDSENQVSHRLDKTLFAAGIQCAKRLYQEYHDPRSIPAPNEIRKTLVEIGERLIGMACEGFPNGERIEAETHEAAVEETVQKLESESGAAVFNAAFTHNGVDIRCDIVLPSRDDKTVDIFEVKSGTKVKPRHVMDVALQMWVIESSGYTVRSASLLHLDAEYRHDGGKNFPVHRVFKNADVTKKAHKRKRRIPDYIDSFQSILDDESTLDLPTGTWCINPIPCCYLPKCRKLAPEFPLLEFPDLSTAQEAELHQAGIETIDQIAPETEGLTPTQKRVLRSLSKDGLVLEELVAEELDTVVFPVCIVATETALQVLPRFPGTRPWQHVPFLWHARVVHEDGTVEERSFIGDGTDDPRAEFVSSLTKCIDDVGTVITWSRRLEPALRQIMEDVSELKDDIRCLLQMDPLALDTIAKDGFYHHAQAGSFDRRAVHAALTGTELETRKNDIVDEEDARAAFERMLNTRTRSTTRTKLREDLANYGARQSLAMLEIYKVLVAATTT